MQYIFSDLKIHCIMNDLPERGRIGRRDTFTRLGVTNGKDILDTQIINMYDRSYEWTDMLFGANIPIGPRGFV